MRLSPVIFFTVSILLCGCARDREAAKIFGNRSYFVGNERKADQIWLTNGSYTKRFFWDVFYDGTYVYGDFNHDGLKDAAVIIVVNPGGGNLNSYELAFLINDGNELVHRASCHLDNWAIINSVKEKNGKVIADMYVHQKGDCNAGPSKRVRNIYEYTGPDEFMLKVDRMT